MTVTIEKKLPWIIFFVLMLIYAGFRTKNYYWDGIYFAQLIEGAGSLNSSLIHPNHPLYNPFGYIFYELVRGLGFHARAITVLQVINCVLSSLTAVVLFYVLRKCFRSANLAVVLTFLFSFSATWWKFSTDANSYIPSILFLIVCFYLILPDRKARPLLVALTHTISMCFHQLAVFFFPVAVLGIFLQTSSLPTKERFRQIGEYCGASFFGTFGIYCLSYYLQAGNLNLREFAGWLTHYSMENGFVFNIKESLTHTFRGEIKLFFEGRFNFLREIINLFTMFLIILMLAALVGLAVQIYRIWKERKTERFTIDFGVFRSLILLCAVWASSYLIFLFFWIPKNTFYRMFYLPSFIVLIGILLSRYGFAEKRKWLAPFFVAVMAISNFLFFIYPYSHVRKVTPLELALEMNNVWSQGTVVFYSKLEQDNYLIRYINPETKWKELGDVKIEDFESEVKNIYASGGDVWIETSAFEQFSHDTTKAEWLRNHSQNESSFRLEDPAYNVTLIRVVP